MFVGIAHELLAGDDGAVATDRQVADAVHLLRQGFLGQQVAVAAHQHQAGLHGVEVHLDPAFRLGANAAVGHYQGLAVGHPGNLVRPEAVSRDLAAVLQSLAVETVDAEHAATGIGSVVLGGVEPFAALVEHAVAVEVAVFLRDQGLQQATVVQVDQVAFGAWPAGDEQRQRQARVLDDVMAALGHAGGELALAVQAVAHRVMLAIGVVARRQHQRLATLAAEAPAAEGQGAEQQAAQADHMTSQHGADLSRHRWR